MSIFLGTEALGLITANMASTSPHTRAHAHAHAQTHTRIWHLIASVMSISSPSREVVFAKWLALKWSFKNQDSPAIITWKLLRNEICSSDWPFSWAKVLVHVFSAALSIRTVAGILEPSFAGQLAQTNPEDTETPKCQTHAFHFWSSLCDPSGLRRL